MLLTENIRQNSKIPVKFFECSELGCNKVFSTSFNLSRHLIIHSGNSPFSCDKCFKGFNQKVNLVKHLRSHDTARLRRNRITEDNSSKNLMCKRSFSVNLNQKHHFVTFQGKSPVCEEKTSQVITTPISCDFNDCNEDFKKEKQGADLFSDGETTTQDTLPHTTFLGTEKSLSDSLSFSSISSMTQGLNHQIKPLNISVNSEFSSEALISNVSSEEDDYNLTFTSLKSYVPRNSLRKPLEYRDFILSQFPSLNEEFEEMRYIISRLLWVMEHSDTERVRNHKDCILLAFTELKHVLESGGEITSQHKALLTFGDLKIRDTTIRADNQPNSNTANKSLSSCADEKLTAPDNDAFTKLARHFVCAPGNYDPDSMSLDTLSFEGVDADDEVVATRSETRSNGDVGVDSIHRCRCCSFRGIDCVGICKCEYDWFLLHGEWPTPANKAKSTFKP